MLEVDRNHWVDVWRTHGAETRHEHPYRQVMRTSGGEPVSDAAMRLVETDVLTKLDLCSSHDVADLGCGNGHFTRLMAPQCRSIVACDVSPDLLQGWDSCCPENVERRAMDVRQLDVNGNRFDRVLAYAVLQYFTLPEALVLLRTLVQSVRPGGRVLLGDLPDLGRMWQFFDTTERRAQYFRGLQDAVPLIGTWYDPEWIRHAAEFVGFDRVQTLPQPEQLPYAHFRFDAILSRAGEGD